MPDYSLALPADFDDYAPDLEAKGWFGDAVLIVSGRRFRLCFYDPVRLAQEIESEFERGAEFFEPNLVVIPSITKQKMLLAAERLAGSKRLDQLLPEQS
ncbi:hypothetical protein MCELHM10_03905 [Paracoccaceae bacterium]